MNTSHTPTRSVDVIHIQRDISIAAPVELVFESILEQLGEQCEMPGGKPFPMTFEAWPGGRWFRDLGNNSGHLWGHVQVIKPPTLIEITGPLMMSYAVTNHVQYKLVAQGDKTQLLFTHSGVGLIQADHRDGLLEGWTYWLDHIAKVAASKVS